MRIPSRRIALKPGITTSTRYRPGGRLGAVYTPLFVVTTTRCWFVASLANVTVTPATGAPARSLIAPVTSAPATCASTSDGVAAIAAAATSHQPDTQTLTRRIRTPLPNERVPIGLGLLLDISDSMYGKRIADARAAVGRFLFTLLDESDQFFLVAFNHRPRTLTGWTHEHEEVDRALAALKPSGGTSIYDAIIESLPLIDHRNRQRAALLVISDGADTASTATLRDVRTSLLRSDAFVYAVAIDSPEPQPINTRVNAQALREITSESGGRTEIVQSSADLEAATARIAEELNSQYVLGYNSSHRADGKFHSIRVRVAGVDYRVRSRNGYVATPR